MSGGLLTWPPAGTAIPVNPHIVLEGYASDGAIVRAIDDRQAVLAGPDFDVPLRIVERNEGAVGIVQVVLVPTEELAAATVYDLRIPRVDEPVASWETRSGPDHQAPRWSGDPDVGATVYQRLGCGPEAHVDVRVPATDDGGVITFRADVEEVGGAPVGRYIVVRRPTGTIEIGHGMCSGAFRLEPNSAYRVRLTAIDPAGNERAAPAAVLIRGPGPDDAEAPPWAVSSRPASPAGRFPSVTRAPAGPAAEPAPATPWERLGGVVALALTAIGLSMAIRMGARGTRARALRRLRRAQANADQAPGLKPQDVE